ncbi:MAG: ATP-binding protein [Oscillospiraceae bacterium]|nr:ATP-binding protein [Oscillospiraceae bacterium]
MNIFNVDLNGENLSLKDLIQFAETKAVTTSILKEYLAVSILEDENVLSQVCEMTQNVGNSLKAMVLEDLNYLWKEMLKPILEGYVPSLKRELLFKEFEQSIKSIVSSGTPEEMMDALISHYSKFGAGKNAQFIAFRWKNGLNGVESPDDITLDELFCLNNQKEELIKNTCLFLQGLPANNALLYGDSGSGKSSMVKALLNKFYKDGLRLVEIPKASLGELAILMDHVKNKRFKYIIFVDDLSFEKDDIGYKNLKVVLEGQIEKQPQNVLLYATSNRRHIISETWAERQGDEVHVRDTMNEKFSLSERFGLRVHFSSPNQDVYFKIIEGILAKDDIPLTDEIKAEAVKWELSHNGRSGRAAAQFAKMIVLSKEKYIT